MILPYACVQARVKEQQTQKQLLTVRSMAPSSPLLNETHLWKHWLTERKDQSALTAMYDEIITGVSCFFAFLFLCLCLGLVGYRANITRTIPSRFTLWAGVGSGLIKPMSWTTVVAMPMLAYSHAGCVHCSMK